MTTNLVLPADLQKSPPQDWLVDGGEMGKVIRSIDWGKTPLGPIELWPQSLRTAVSLCLFELPHLPGLGTQACADL
jgi:hypothetical protein